MVFCSFSSLHNLEHDKLDSFLQEMYNFFNEKNFFYEKIGVLKASKVIGESEWKSSISEKL